MRGTTPVSKGTPLLGMYGPSRSTILWKDIYLLITMQTLIGKE